MIAESIPNQPSRAVDRHWLEIVRRHSDAKTLARCGQVEQAYTLLRNSLPELIRNWSRVSGLPRNMQILRLRKLLMGKVKANPPTPISAETPTPTPLPTPMPTPAPLLGSEPEMDELSAAVPPIEEALHAASSGIGVAQRIPLSDISAMIDAVLLAESEARSALSHELDASGLALAS